MDNVNVIEMVAKDQGFYFSGEGGNYMFSTVSPAGQVCDIKLSGSTFKEVTESVQKFAEGYDVSTETYLWLDKFGHGKNGAPYDMRDCYDAMAWFKYQAKELAWALKSAFDSIESDEPDMLNAVATVNNDTFKLYLSHIGEGYYSDYDEDIDDDAPLLRLDVKMKYTEDEVDEDDDLFGEWHEEDDYSTCTVLEANISIEDAQKILNVLLEQITKVYEETEGCSVEYAVQQVLCSDEVYAVAESLYSE